MFALICRVRFNSLYSIRIPFTWQSALTYPILPPSAIYGFLAHALLCSEDMKYPEEYLEEVEEKGIWVGSRLLTPCVVESYVVLNVIKWKSGFPRKFTNAMSRQFAYTRFMEVVAIFEDREIVDRLREALRKAPLYCGDSESLITVEDVRVRKVERTGKRVIKTAYPFIWRENFELLSGRGKIYMMHDRCLKRGELLLKPFIVPVEERGNFYIPTEIEIRLADGLSGRGGDNVERGQSEKKHQMQLSLLDLIREKVEEAHRKTQVLKIQEENIEICHITS